MMQKLTFITTHPATRIVLGALLVLSIVFISGTPNNDTVVYGQVSEVREGVGATGGNTSGNARNDLYSVIEDIINIFSIVVGVIAVIMIIIGGLKYITSGGDSNSVSSAKNTIIYAIVGLIVVAFAQVIVLFVLDTVD